MAFAIHRVARARPPNDLHYYFENVDNGCTVFGSKRRYACFRANAKNTMRSLLYAKHAKMLGKNCSDKKLKTDCALASLLNCLLLCAFRQHSEKEAIWKMWIVLAALPFGMFHRDFEQWAGHIKAIRSLLMIWNHFLRLDQIDVQCVLHFFPAPYAKWVPENQKTRKQKEIISLRKFVSIISSAHPS